jgi:asparagine N-glycosylation enzyme membrane subunit Stt3
MNRKMILEGAEALLAVCVCITLFLSACVFLIAFAIGWEDRFFGMALEGLPAGAFLLAKTAGALIVLYFLAHYPRYRNRAVPAAFLYYTFLSADAVVTLREYPRGSGDYAFFVLVMSCLSLLLLLIHGSLALHGPLAGEEGRGT